VVPAGPTVTDSVANAAFYYGLIVGLPAELVEQIPFETAKRNFYDCAKNGLSTTLVWQERSISLSELVTDVLLPYAQQGLNQLGVREADSTLYLNVIKQRIEQQQNGATWQRQFMQQHGATMQQLTECYIHHQQTGQPVHTWGTTC